MTGKVNLDQEDPNKLEQVLKYIYADCTQAQSKSHDEMLILLLGTPLNYGANRQGPQPWPVRLEEGVDYWLLADFFLLPALNQKMEQTMARDMADYAQYLYLGTIGPDIPQYMREHNNSQALQAFMDGFQAALRKAYQNTTAYTLHRLFVIFAYMLGAYFPADLLKGLMAELPVFRKDLSQMLCAAHFGTEERWEVCRALRGQGLGASCTTCDVCGDFEVVPASPLPPEFGLKIRRIGGPRYVVPDPFAGGAILWCTSCASSRLLGTIEEILATWPEENEEIETPMEEDDSSVFSQDD